MGWCSCNKLHFERRFSPESENSGSCRSGFWVEPDCSGYLFVSPPSCFGPRGESWSRGSHAPPAASSILQRLSHPEPARLLTHSSRADVITGPERRADQSESAEATKIVQRDVLLCTNFTELSIFKLFFLWFYIVVTRLWVEYIYILLQSDVRTKINENSSFYIDFVSSIF